MAHLIRVGLEFFRDLIASEGSQSTHGFMQRLDVRVKVLGVTTLIVLTVWVQSPVFQAIVLAFCYALAYISRIRLGRLFSRSLAVIVPAFIIALPRALLSLFSPNFLGFQMFSDDWGFLLLFTLRIASASTALILLISSTSFSDILSCLRWLRLPNMLLWVMATTHRYLILLSTELYRLTLARESRVHKTLSLRGIWKDGGKMLGTFFIRSIERGERIQMATLSRSGGSTLKFYPQSFKLSISEVAFILPIAFLTCLGLVICL